MYHGSATTSAANDNKTIILLSSQGRALSFFGQSERNKITMFCCASRNKMRGVGAPDQKNTARRMNLGGSY